MEQLNLFNMNEGNRSMEPLQNLEVVKAEFIEGHRANWEELFDGFDEMYAITYSTGITFMGQIIDKFQYAEVILGFEDIVDSNLAVVMAVEVKLVELITKSKSAKIIAELMEQKRLKLSVSRDTKSHEKTFILKANDGRTRVITGSANMSASAFCGYQREDIVYFDNRKAYEWYYARFCEFQESCSDNVNYKALQKMINGDKDLLRESPEEIPIMQTLQSKKIVVIEGIEPSQLLRPTRGRSL